MCCDLVKSVLHHRHKSNGFWSVILTETRGMAAISPQNPQTPRRIQKFSKPSDVFTSMVRSKRTAN